MSANAPEPTSANHHHATRPGAFVRFMNGVSRVCLYLAALALAAIVVINGVNVFCRYVLFHALSWAEEGMVFLMIFGVFVGAITVTWEQIHIRIDAFIAMLPRVLRLMAEWMTVLIAAAVMIPIGLSSAQVVSMLYEFDQRSDGLNMPVWIPQVTIPFALVLIPVVMALVLILRGVDTHKKIE